MLFAWHLRVGDQGGADRWGGKMLGGSVWSVTPTVSMKEEGGEAWAEYGAEQRMWGGAVGVGALAGVVAGVSSARPGGFPPLSWVPEDQAQRRASMNP